MPAYQNEEQVLGKAYDAHLMRRLLRYIRPYRGAAALAFVAIDKGSTPHRYQDDQSDQDHIPPIEVELAFHGFSIALGVIDHHA